TVTFDSTVDGAQALTVTGDSVFEDEVGVGANLTSLHVTGASDINTDKITTTGAQDYDGAVTLTSDTDLTATTVTFGSTVDGVHALTIDGDAEFDGEVGVGTALTSLLVNGATMIDTDAITTSGTQE